MITQEQPKRLKPQECPLCGEPQDIIVNGHIDIPDQPNMVMFQKDRGYSFCNCRNIFYTSWANMKTETYDQDYASKYNSEAVKDLVKNYRIYIPEGNWKRFLEIGAASDAMLEVALSKGYEVSGVDIMRRESKFNMIFANFETFQTGEKYDFIFASHVVEHFRYPVEAVKKMFDMLNPGGNVFIAMPDPYFIDLKHPDLWGHWHLIEHHIFWDMQSFIELMEEIGFRCEISRRNAGREFVCIGDYHLLFVKP